MRRPHADRKAAMNDATNTSETMRSGRVPSVMQPRATESPQRRSLGADEEAIHRRRPVPEARPPAAAAARPDCECRARASRAAKGGGGTRAGVGSDAAGGTFISEEAHAQRLSYVEGLPVDGRRRSTRRALRRRRRRRPRPRCGELRHRSLLAVAEGGIDACGARSSARESLNVFCASACLQPALTAEPGPTACVVASVLQAASTPTF